MGVGGKMGFGRALLVWDGIVTHGRGSEGETGDWSGYPVSLT